MKGKFIIADGLDGAGKGTAITALKELMLSKNLKVLDLKEYWQTNKGFPDISGYDVIISAEPTFTNIGKKIREEMVRGNNNYSDKEIAHAYADDRKELFQKIIIPALNAGKHVFQERGVITSLVYQPLMEDKDITIDYVKNLEGNKLCLNYPPDLLVITLVDPKAALKRLDERDKKDNCVFETFDFQTKVKSIYESEWLKELFQSKGAKIAYMNTDPPSTPEDTKSKILKIFNNLLNTSTTKSSFSS